MESSITLQFLAEVPLRQFCWELLKGQDDMLKCKIHSEQNHNAWCEDCQQLIVNVTINHRVAKKFPPSLNYRKAFVKWILNKVESIENDVCEDLYYCYVQLLSETNAEFYYKSHHIPSSEEFIVMQESRNIISGGTTGLVSWKGGMLLAEWMLFNKELFSGTFLLELGSGCGFTGLVVLKGTDVSHYTFTDCHQTVLSLLKQNIDVNQISSERYTIAEHVWGKLDDCRDFMPDYVLAADVVFDPDLVSDLVISIACFMNQSKQKTVFMAITERNPQTYKCFLHELDAHKLKYRDLDTSKVPRLFYYDKNEHIHLLKVKAATS
uniref:Protein FAM86A n=1 Tax=Phallusia mammillata TaxID=59560 RepID=A0A6F9DCG9_9ASCI|nr:protein FAM86A [Phallusia mammillata]